ncbi:rhomboid family intramembrane serine protease [Rhizobium bangladeshense]|uniref:Rhomboid family intramembrane serine protease n=1 Tax=Rhizobium bangladeshense TaxID=1138189 RepID=A0ABS7LRB9_9HYPH|nr:rhomboid family intramembrane serine protease [Rhizobium bangladeshense]MBX4867915.1 rhomboid family intramembrane serine protease [Rhizobium bangladeshense]MBX4875204.1 rhomboid family intramembrane serine protease [Rhizobium bangladeshense]MBX4886117.1 rhomboid family intramembrane serine protease [Rhizobium bangladeshense]MBY3594021.1 rhomboid family intramembrane serine protease [Rhizobium bangladeshense]
MNEQTGEPQKAPEPSEVQPPARPQRVPVFNLPPALLFSLCLLILVYAVQALVLSDDAVSWLLFTFGFVPARYVIPLSQQGLELFWTPVTYSLLHGSAQHIVFNAFWLMAFGAPVVRRIGTLRFLFFWIFSAAASAALHTTLNWGDVSLLIGASGVISGLMGAACRFAFPPDRRPMAVAHLNARLSIIDALKSRTVVIFMLLWLVGNALIAVGVPLVGDSDQEIAWDAHIGGFVFGFFLFSLFDRALRLPAEPTEPEKDMLQS